MQPTNNQAVDKDEDVEKKINHLFQGLTKLCQIRAPQKSITFAATQLIAITAPFAKCKSIPTFTAPINTKLELRKGLRRNHKGNSNPK
jgi:hypothetical protein